MATQLPVLTVSQLNRQVKNFLENEIGLLQVEGEVSNLSKPYSGHFYFTLKDSSAQIRCVFFKNRHQGEIAKALSDGQHVVAAGKLSLYEARGDYQLIVEQLTPAGLGALYQRFEELKAKLAAEGLFEASRKKAIPAFPMCIGLITSASGAALQDILSTLARRFPLPLILVYPSEVQGAGAPRQLISALQRANSDKRCDVLILARGGGSIEDLWAFNDEALARQIALSQIPIIAGIGHETDFTIADFVADCRAETPTAAAARATPDKLELLLTLDKIQSRMAAATLSCLQQYRLKLRHLCDKLASPKQAISSYWQRLDHLERQLQMAMEQTITRNQHRLQLQLAQLNQYNPQSQVNRSKAELEQLHRSLQQLIQQKLQTCRYRFNQSLATLQAVSPLATLERGYAIATKNTQVLYSTETVKAGDMIGIQLAKGRLECQVLGVIEQSIGAVL